MVSVVTVGSFARREASPESDLDFFIIANSEGKYESVGRLVSEALSKLDIKMPSSSGAFNATIERDGLTRNVGGFEDNTENLTRRMLFLLECEWLYNEKLFVELFDEIIEKYVRETITEHQLCRFLLNDLIRYYRTICVDFEYKTNERGKSWGDRNIKLMFSRKLMYFSGIIVIAETVQHRYNAKREILNRYLRKTPLQRIDGICGNRSEKVLELYDEFLKHMSKPKVRTMLNSTTHDRTEHSDEFRLLKNKGHHFSWELSKLLSETYDSSHPIHHAIKF